MTITFAVYTICIRFSHWDVDNEQLHEAWYAEKLGQPDFLSRAFKFFHEMQPDVTLFTNDFNVFVTGMFTQVSNTRVVVCEMRLRIYVRRLP